jgi:hypothetical protein
MPLFIPGGHYKLTGQLSIPSGLVMYGAGQEPVNGTPTRLNFSGIASGTASIVINGGSNIWLHDFYVTGRSSGSADEISVIGLSRAVVLERITVNTSTTGSAFALATTGGGSHSLIKSSVRNCTAVGAGYGFRIGSSSTSTDFAQCYANVCTLAGYLIQGNAALPAFLDINDASDYVTCIGCVDTTPNAASTAAVSNWNGTAPTTTTLINNDFTAKGVHSSLRDTLTVRVAALSAGVAAKAPLKIPHGVAPTSPVDGDIWTTTSGLFVRVNGSTVGPLT